VVSALEGGYRIQGGIVSAFARSVAAHVRALAEGHDQQWDPADAQVCHLPFLVTHAGLGEGYADMLLLLRSLR